MSPYTPQKIERSPVTVCPDAPRPSKARHSALPLAPLQLIFPDERLPQLNMKRTSSFFTDLSSLDLDSDELAWELSKLNVNVPRKVRRTALQRRVDRIDAFTHVHFPEAISRQEFENLSPPKTKKE